MPGNYESVFSGTIKKVGQVSCNLFMHSFKTLELVASLMMRR